MLKLLFFYTPVNHFQTLVLGPCFAGMALPVLYGSYSLALDKAGSYKQYRLTQNFIYSLQLRIAFNSNNMYSTF